jgi:dynein heavy chain
MEELVSVRSRVTFFILFQVGEKFRNRAMRFPALISGCTIDWFQPWPKDALVLVAKYFLAEFEIACSLGVKNKLVSALGNIQAVVASVSTEYFQRYIFIVWNWL